MDQKTGYKKTKIGWIPEEWSIKRYKDVLKEIDRQYLWDDNLEYHLISVRRRNGGCFFRESLLGHQIKTKTLRPIQRDDFIISKMQVVHGATSVVPSSFDGMFVSSSYLIMNACPILNIHYMNYWAQLPKFYNDVLISSHGVHIEKMTFKLSSFKKQLMPLPPLPEQQKIASILTTVDDKLSSIENQIQQTEQLKKGLMEKLLTEGIGHTEFKDTKIGKIPREWRISKFEDETRLITCGVASTPKYVDPENGIPFLSSQNVKDGKMKLEKYSYISKDFHKELTKNNKPEKGDILYTRVGANFGEACVIDIDLEFSVYVSLTLIKVKNENDSNFVKYLLNSQYYKKLAKRSVFQGAGVPNLNVKVVRNFIVGFPPFPEQKQIASILSTVDDKIETLTQKKSEYQTLKKGLMAELLTGKRRVKV